MSDGQLWLQRLRTAPDARGRLFCFPHAGGHSVAFRPWPALLPDAFDVISVQLPGRANRLREAPIASMDTLVDRLAGAMDGLLDKPFVFFGHSMGAALAWALTRELERRGAPLPVHLVVSGRRGPRVPRREPDLTPLTDAEFVAEMMARYGGIPAELLRHADVMELLLPAMRADIAALEGYATPEPRPLPVPLSAFGGQQDRLITRDDLAAWGAETAGPFRLRLFPGGHFYHDEQRAAVVGELSAILAAIPSRALEAQF